MLYRVQLAMSVIQTRNVSGILLKVALSTTTLIMELTVFYYHYFVLYSRYLLVSQDYLVYKYFIMICAYLLFTIITSF
jgi:hypothetical protein